MYVPKFMCIYIYTIIYIEIYSTYTYNVLHVFILDIMEYRL